MRPLRPRLVVLAAVAALVVLGAQAGCSRALLDIVWRASVLSWDSPSTQLLDEMASQAAPAVDAVDGPPSPAVTAAREILSLRADAPPGPVASGAVTRAPPSV